MVVCKCMLKPAKGILLVLFSLKITIFLIAFISHVIGITATCLYKKRTNQNLILFLLSIVELSICIVGIINKFYEDYITYMTLNTRKAFRGLEYIFIYQLVFIMYILTIDRLICICSPLKYKLRVSKTKISIAFILTSAISILLVTIEHTSSFSVGQVTWYVHIFIGSSFVLVALITYGIVFYKLKKSAEQFSIPGTNEAKKNIKKQFLVPGLLISTFLVFYVIPSSVMHIRILGRDYKTIEALTTKTVYLGICQIFMISGMVADSVTYIFLSKHYRSIIFSWFQCCNRYKLKKQSNDSETNDSRGTLPSVVQSSL